jgi:hypothetical protein
MTKGLIIAVFGISLFSLSANASEQFSTDFTFVSPAAEVAVITGFNYTVKNDRIYFHWTVSGNQAADKFELEGSTDGISFNSLALVFGTDVATDNSYTFYLSKKRHTGVYRIRITQKDGTVQYHAATIEVK